MDEMLMAEITFTFSAKCAKAFAPMCGVVFCGQEHRFLELDLLLKKYFRGSFFSMERVCWAIDWHGHHDPKNVTSVFGVSILQCDILICEGLTRISRTKVF